MALQVPAAEEEQAGQVDMRALLDSERDGDVVALQAKSAQSPCVCGTLHAP